MSSSDCPNKHQKPGNDDRSLLLSHYVTTYGYAFDRPWKGFKSKPITTDCLSYAHNRRPVVQYNRSIDQLDNPSMLNCLEKSYETTSQANFKKHELNQRDSCKVGFGRPAASNIRDGVNLTITDQNTISWDTEYRSMSTKQKPIRGSLPTTKKQETGYTNNIKLKKELMTPCSKLPCVMGPTTYAESFGLVPPRNIDPCKEKEQVSVVPGGYSKGNEVKVDFVPLNEKETFRVAQKNEWNDLFSHNRPEYWNRSLDSKYPSMTKCEYQCKNCDRRDIISDAHPRLPDRGENETGTTRNVKPVLVGIPSPADQFVTHNMLTYDWKKPTPGSHCASSIEIKDSAFSISESDTGFRSQGVTACAGSKSSSSTTRFTDACGDPNKMAENCPGRC